MESLVTRPDTVDKYQKSNLNMVKFMCIIYALSSCITALSIFFWVGQASFQV